MPLQVVGEKLSLHVLANYEEFVRGVNEVASIEKDLQVCNCKSCSFAALRPHMLCVAQIT